MTLYRNYFIQFIEIDDNNQAVFSISKRGERREILTWVSSVSQGLAWVDLQEGPPPWANRNEASIADIKQNLINQ